MPPQPPLGPPIDLSHLDLDDPAAITARLQTLGDQPFAVIVGAVLAAIPHDLARPPSPTLRYLRARPGTKPPDGGVVSIPAEGWPSYPCWELEIQLPDGGVWYIFDATIEEVFRTALLSLARDVVTALQTAPRRPLP